MRNNDRYDINKYKYNLKNKSDQYNHIIISYKMCWKWI